MWKRLGKAVASLLGRTEASAARASGGATTALTSPPAAPTVPGDTAATQAPPAVPFPSPAVFAAPVASAPSAPPPASPAADTESDDEEEDDGDDDGDDENEQDALDEEEEDRPRGRPDREERRRQRSARDRMWFGEEVWGASQRHRSAAVDVTRLQRFDLPLCGSERDLADWLGIPLSRLRWYTHDRAAETTWHYTRYTIPKRSGGERVILAPKRELKALQRKVLDGILARVPTAPAVHGFVPGRSVVTNARPHVGKQVLLRLDLKDFFPSVTFPRVRGLFISLGYSFSVAATLALLCTEYAREAFDRDGTRYFISIGPRHLVQGAPTSPALANLVAWQLDRRLTGLAVKHGFTYTRYADDLTFSGDSPDEAQRIRVIAQRIVRDERFAVNAAKTRVARRSARQMVTGLVVNDGIGAPRALRRRLRAILHNAEQSGLAAQNRDRRSNFGGYLRGLIAFVHAAGPQHAARLRASLERAAGSGKRTLNASEQ